jgi:hypothetical protein
MNLFLKMKGRLAIAKSAYNNLKQSQPKTISTDREHEAGLFAGRRSPKPAVMGLLSGK